MCWIQFFILIGVIAVGGSYFLYRLVGNQEETIEYLGDIEETLGYLGGVCDLLEDIRNDNNDFHKKICEISVRGKK